MCIVKTPSFNYFEKTTIIILSQPSKHYFNKELFLKLLSILNINLIFKTQKLYFKKLNLIKKCQKAEAGAGRVRYNLLLLTKEFNYRLCVENLYLQKCLLSHFI